LAIRSSTTQADGGRRRGTCSRRARRKRRSTRAHSTGLSLPLQAAPDTRPGHRDGRRESWSVRPSSTPTSRHSRLSRHDPQPPRKPRRHRRSRPAPAWLRARRPHTVRLALLRLAPVPPLGVWAAACSIVGGSLVMLVSRSRCRVPRQGDAEPQGAAGSPRPLFAQRSARVGEALNTDRCDFDVAHIRCEGT
jgi:hypothetical protein